LTSLASDFHRIFAGLERSHGRYVVPPGAKPDDKGKLHDTKWARTVHDRLTVELWDEHLKGVFGLGVVPIRDDATCVFGAIDVDVYPLDLAALLALVRRLELPLVLCRTKSGGAHLYLFTRGPVRADLLRSKLMDWAVRLGYPGVEVFPKQTRLASEKDDGSWINAPYNGGKRSTRYALKQDGSAMTPEEFVEEADRIAVDPDDLPGIEPASIPDPAADDFAGGPPCLQTLARRGFGEWQNNGLFNICVYLRKRFGEGWSTRVDEYNRKYLSPPVPSRDVAAMMKTASKKTYSYMCKQEPICGVCNRQVCLTRDFGVGGLGDDPGVVVGEILKVETDPPLYIIDVNAARIECEFDDLLDQRRFRKLVGMKLDILITFIKQSTWDGMMRERLGRIQRKQVPEDATKEGQFWVHVARFCTSKVRGKSLDEMLLGKPFTDPEKRRTYFQSADLFQYLSQHRFNGFSEKDAFRWMRRREVQHHQGNVKGKFVNYWSLPAFPEQTEEHAVPRVPPPDRM
jgi:hypothetical protein